MSQFMCGAVIKTKRPDLMESGFDMLYPYWLHLSHSGTEETFVGCYGEYQGDREVILETLTTDCRAIRDRSGGNITDIHVFCMPLSSDREGMHSAARCIAQGGDAGSEFIRV